jgi:hypothetical protein
VWRDTGEKVVVGEGGHPKMVLMWCDGGSAHESRDRQAALVKMALMERMSTGEVDGNETDEDGLDGDA